VVTSTLQGLVDLVDRKAYSFEGPNGDSVVEGPVPESMAAEVEQHRSRLVEAVPLLACLICILSSRDQMSGNIVDGAKMMPEPTSRPPWCAVML